MKAEGALALQPMVTFKGVQNGFIAWEFASGEYTIGPIHMD